MNTPIHDEICIRDVWPGDVILYDNEYLLFIDNSGRADRELNSKCINLRTGAEWIISNTENVKRVNAYLKVTG